MKLTIEIPDHKFNVGDFVRYTKSYRHEGFLIIARIDGIHARGSWEVNSGYNPYLDFDYYDYHATCQEGCLTTEGTPIRPGTFQMSNVEELDELGELVNYQGKVWTPDTPDNLNERMEKSNPGP